MVDGFGTILVSRREELCDSGRASRSAKVREFSECGVCIETVWEELED
jgi:hypothetical protein